MSPALRSLAQTATRAAQRGRTSLQSARALPPEQAAAALQDAVNCAAALVNAGLVPTADAPAPRKDWPRVSFVVPSIKPTNLHALQRSIECTFAPGTWEMVHIPDAQSMNEAFARGAEHATTDLLIFCHDDVILVEPEFQRLLVGALESADLVGVCGTTRVIGPGIVSAGLPYVHGWVTHRNAKGRPLPSIFSARGSRVDGIQALDGLFMAARRSLVEAIGFDQATFDGWHLYDMDFSYRAHKAGFRVRLQSDLLLIHASTGNFDELYLHYAQRFAAKHAELVMPTQPGAPLFQTVLKSDAAVPAFYRWIKEWSREG